MSPVSRSCTAMQSCALDFRACFFPCLSSKPTHNKQRGLQACSALQTFLGKVSTRGNAACMHVESSVYPMRTCLTTGRLVPWHAAASMVGSDSSLVGVQATSYLNKLPSSFSPEDRILVADPMLATGMYCSCSQPCNCSQYSCSPNTL